jgi:hypothetical protein
MSVPRALFDLIPGEAFIHHGRDGEFLFWAKELTLAKEPGRHVPLTVCCVEPAPHLTPNPSPIGEGDEPLLRETEPV